MLCKPHIFRIADAVLERLCHGHKVKESTDWFKYSKIMVLMTMILGYVNQSKDKNNFRP